MKKSAVFCLILSLLIGGCAYKGKIKSDFSTPKESSSEKVDGSVVISNKGNLRPLKAKGSFGSYEIRVTPGLQKSLKSSLESHFEKVAYQNTPDTYDFNIKVGYDASPIYIDNYSGSRKYKTKLTVSFNDSTTGEELQTYSQIGKINYADPPNVAALSFLTGASLFALSPITIPASIQSAGKHGQDLVKRDLKILVRQINEQIEKDKGSFRLALGQNRSSPSSENQKSKSKTVSSKYDPFLDAVVLIRTSQGFGSGFFIKSEGLIVTNQHLVKNQQSVTVTIRNGQSLFGQVKATDRSRDLALVKVPNKNFSSLNLAFTENENYIGQEVYAIGAPEGLTWSLSNGIVSSRRTVGDVKHWQTDAAINKGNSGGPLLLQKTGEVIGVNKMGIPKNVSEGLSFAVSASEIKEAFPSYFNEN